MVLGRRGEGKAFWLGHVSDRILRYCQEAAVWVVARSPERGKAMEGKGLCKAAVSVIIQAPGRGGPPESWPGVIICGPEDADCPEPEEDGRQILELIYDAVRVVGILVEEDDQMIIRVEVHELHPGRRAWADTGGKPTLK